MDVQDQYLDIQVCDKHFNYLVSISKYSAVISKIFILTYFNILYNKAECSDITVQYLNITIEYIRCLSHIVDYTEKNGCSNMGQPSYMFNCSI